MKYIIILSAVLLGGVWTLSSFTKDSVKLVNAVPKGNGGITFSTNGLEKAKKDAKKKGKIIFIDVYTTWCGPCKQMAATTFMDGEVGALFNDKFINLKVDAENDVDGPGVASTYKVAAYPTLLFIDSDGKLVKKLVGSQSKEKLMQVARSL